MVMMNNDEYTDEPQKPYEPPLSEVLDYHVMCASGAALEIADQNGHPFLTHNSSDFVHKITGQARPVFCLVFAGDNANEVGQRISHYARELLKISPENKEANTD
jgi:hypothetical protein